MASEAPFQLRAHVDVAVASVCGPVRETNEDAALVIAVDPEHLVGIVSDGMGGHEGGREAAEIVTRELSERLRRRGAEGWARALAEAFQGAHAEVRRAAQRRGYGAMGATAIAAVVDVRPQSPTLHLAHVGDSRAHLLRGRSLVRLTADHSVVAQWVREGLLSEREVGDHPDRGVLQRAIGQRAPLNVEVHPPLALDAGDCLLLTSDGLHAALADEEMVSAVLAAHSADDACARLVAAALAAASEDNVSVVCVQLPPLASDGGGCPTRPESRRRAEGRR